MLNFSQAESMVTSSFSSLAVGHMHLDKDVKPLGHNTLNKESATKVLKEC